jgi:hypothetical protein
VILCGATPTSLQLSWERGSPPTNYLSVIAKRSYNLDRYGRIVVADEQEPLLAMSGDEARDGCLEHDSDIWPSKPLTDVVIQGHLYPSSITARFTARVQIGPIVKDLLVTGDRRATLAGDGRIVFSRPEAIDKVPLTYAHAYGGIDRVTEERYGNPMMVFDAFRRPELQPEYHSPFIYPRNAAGRGYLLEASAEAVAALELPNIEDPLDPVTEQRLLVANVKRWPFMPLPWGTQWLHPASFPRVAYAGAARQFEFNGPWPEAARGFAEPEFPQLGPIHEVLSPRFSNGGSLGLQLAPFTGSRGGIDVRLHGFVPGGGEYRFSLPGQPPKLAVDGRDGKLTETQASLHHVVIRPDEGKVIMVWRGEAVARRRYLDEELDKMPYFVEWKD